MSFLDHVAGYDEYIGAVSEIVGADEIVGAMQRNPQAAQQLVARLANVRAAGGVMTVPKAEGVKRKIVPLVPASVGIGGSATFTVQVQEQFRPERFIIGVDPDDFVITSLKVATREQLAAAGSVPGSVFSAMAWGSYVEFDTANIGNIITVTVANLNAAARTFYGSFIGTSIG